MRWLVLAWLSGCQLAFPARDVELETRCSTPAMFTDPFDGATLHPFWTPGPDDEVPRAGRLEFVHPGDGVHFVRTVSGFQFRDQAISVSVAVDDPARLTDQATRVQFSALAEDFADGNAGGLAVQIRIRPFDGVLRLEVGEQKDGDQSTAYFEPYDPVAHRVWRIAREGDEIVWSAGPDAGVLAELQRSPLPTIDQLDIVRVELASLALGGNAFTAFFDDFNGGGTPSDQACRADLLVDSFDAGTLDEDRWLLPEFGCDVRPAHANGRLVTEFIRGGANTCFVTSRLVYDVVAAPVFVELIDPPSGNGMRSFVSITNLANTPAYFEIENGEIAAMVETTEVSFMPYDANAHRWLQLRGERDGEREDVVFETSPDGKAWTIFAKTGLATGLGTMRVQLGSVGFTDLDPPAPGASFDNLNVAP